MSFLPSRSFPSGGGERPRGIIFEAKEVVLFSEKCTLLGARGGGGWSWETPGVGLGLLPTQGEASWASISSVRFA